MDDNIKISEDFVRLARISLSGNNHDVLLLLRKLSRRYRIDLPQLSEGLLDLIRANPSQVSPIRKAGIRSLPVDVESRLQLVRVEHEPEPEVEPVFSDGLLSELNQIVLERQERSKLSDAGLDPTRTVLFTGAPGVGKTLAAHWLAHKLQVPLLTLNLSAVMSSFLGRTGVNLRQVLDYAKDVECILLIDELDAIAKRRDDASDVGELKRLVTVLLQEIDLWPPLGLLVAATNHSELLDPAVWRRFEKIIHFPMPNQDLIAEAIKRFFESNYSEVAQWIPALAIGLEGLSFSDIERQVMSVRRSSTLNSENLSDQVLAVLKQRIDTLDHKHRVTLALRLIKQTEMSQRHASEFTGVSRDTIRKRMSGNEVKVGD